MGLFQVPWKWLVLIGSFLSRIITTGTVISMGSIFFTELESSFPTWEKPKLAAIFSVAIGLLEGTGIIASLLMRIFESRYLVVFGGVLATIGVAVASQAKEYWQMLICLGILNGFGQGIARCLMPVAVAHSFDDHDRHIAIALQSVGDGIGGLIFPLFFKYTIDEWSWQGALQITAGVVFHLLICGAVVKNHLRKSTSSSASIGDQSNLESIPVSRRQEAGEFRLFPNIAFFLSNILAHSFGYYIFMIFVYSELTKVQHIETSLASAMVACVGGVSILGRLSVSLMSNKRVPRWLIYAVLHVVRGVVVLLINTVPYLASSDYRLIGYFVLCSAFGMTDGITGALIPVVCLDLFGLAKMADVYGLQLFAMGTGAIIGAPIAGAMEDAFSSTTLPLTFSGISFVVAGVILLPLFFTKKHYQIQTNEKTQIELKELTSDSKHS